LDNQIAEKVQNKEWKYQLKKNKEKEVCEALGWRLELRSANQE